MLELTKKLNELIAICEIRIKKVDADSAINAAKSNKLDKQQKEVESLNKIAVEGIERLNKSKAKHKDLEGAEALKKQLSGEIKRYQGMQANLEAKFAEAEKAKKDGLAEVADKRSKLDKDIKNLNEKKKNYQVDMMKAIAEDLRKKGIEL